MDSLHIDAREMDSLGTSGLSHIRPSGLPRVCILAECDATLLSTQSKAMLRPNASVNLYANNSVGDILRYYPRYANFEKRIKTLSIPQT